MPPLVLSITYQVMGADVSVSGGVDPEALITIRGTGFDNPGADVRASVALFPELQIHSRSADSEIQCFIPSVRALETSANYGRNTIQMNLELTVVNANGDSSLVNRFPVRLGPPRPGSMVQNGQEVVFGMPADAEGPGEPADDLGGPAGAGASDDGGQVRWYAGAAPALPAIDFTSLLLTTPPADPMSGRIALPAAVADPLSATRQAGQRLPVAGGDWHDDGLVVTVPEEDGYIVVWRDDIPSPTIHVLDLLPPGVSCNDVAALLAPAFRVDQALPTTLFPGQSLWVVAQRVAGVNNALTALIDNGTIPVSYGFKVSGVPDQDLQTTPNLGNNPQASALDFATALVRPDLFPKEQPPPAGREFTIELVVSVTIPPCGQVDVTTRAGLQCTQLPLGVSTVATFFESSGFDGAPMVMLPAGTLIPGVANQKFDANNSGPLTGARNTIANELFTLTVALSLLSFFAGIAGIPGADELALINTMATRIRNASMAVIDGRGANNDLESAVWETHWWRWDDDFDDNAGSMILVGVPGFGTLEGFADSGFGPQPAAESWGMPAGSIVAAVPDFEHMTDPVTIGSTSIALPYAQQGDSRSGDFDDSMGSIRYT